MDSSILTLKTALEGLTDYCQKWDPSAVHGSDAWGIAAVYQAANRLSDIFSEIVHFSFRDKQGLSAIW